MYDTQRGEGVQVLFVEEDGTYRVDEAALRRVAAHEAARALPVAVVSVAGATRGGKSFLLDFFLRYLRAPEEARRSGAWIGAGDEPLTGFSWRGGCDRHTEGILLWSEPIVVTLGSEENSEKVAVVLMDTQGTFDSSSTVRDSSTIFAMSALLSSVQIYNLSQNIQEDDLQYLQLFTEYGKLARDEEAGRPFQVLQFLVRDWSYAYDHPVGLEGGQQLLDKRLEIRSAQARELQEIRQHVRSAFECVRCCLLPHPGLTVATSPQFRGCLDDISKEFKDALLELVPSLFDPENLILKRVNGQKITIQDLAEYFKTYSEIFNSDSLPTPMTVMQATALVSFELALSAARDTYAAHMERGCRGGRVPRGALPRLHAAALHAARAAAAARRTLAAPPAAAARRDALLQELDARLPNYVAMNNGRTLEAIAASKATYEKVMRSSESCLAPDELTTRHGAAVEAALAAFDASRVDPFEDDDATNVGPSEDDAEEAENRKMIEKDLQDLLPLHRELNEERIACASAAAREAFMSRMRAGCAGAACLHPRSLARLRSAASRGALAAFLQAWHDADAVPADRRTELINYFDEEFRNFESLNDVNNTRAVEESLDFYDSVMNQVFVGDQCLHQRDLAAENDRVEAAALTNFLEKRDQESLHLGLQCDDYCRRFRRGLVRRCLKFVEKNDELNEAAVQQAHDRYLSIMTTRQGAFLDFSVFQRHTPAKNAANAVFMSKRRPTDTLYVEDTYLSKLNKVIEAKYLELKLKPFMNVGMIAVGIASTILLRRPMFW